MVDGPEGHAQPNVARGLVSSHDSFGNVQKIIFQRIAEADGIAGPVERGLLDLLTVGMVVHETGVGVRVAEHLSFEGDDGHPRVRRFLEFAACFVEGGRGGEGDGAGNQSRLDCQVLHKALDSVFFYGVGYVKFHRDNGEDQDEAVEEEDSTEETALFS